MPKTRNSPVKRIILILAGVAFLGGTVLTSLSFLQGEQAGHGGGYPTAEGEASVEERLIAIEEGYTAVLEREPENPTALQGLVQARVEMGKLEEALDPLASLQELSPDDPQILQAIAAINLQLQNFPEALKPLEELAEIQPDNEDLQTQLSALKQIIETGEIPTMLEPEAQDENSNPDTVNNPDENGTEP